PHVRLMTRGGRGDIAPASSRTAGQACLGGRTAPCQMVVASAANMVLTFTPSSEIAPMQMTAMRASSRPYSTSEAPSSALTNFLAAEISLVMVSPPERMVRETRQPHVDRSRSTAISPLTDLSSVGPSSVLYAMGRKCTHHAVPREWGRKA